MFLSGIRLYVYLFSKLEKSQLPNSLYVLGTVDIVCHFNNWKHFKFKGKGSKLERNATKKAPLSNVIEIGIPR